MKNNEVRVEKLEKVQAPCEWCFAAGVGVGIAIIALT